MRKAVNALVTAALLLSPSLIRASDLLPSDAAKNNFIGGHGLCWQVNFNDGWPKLNRIRHHLPLEAYRGTTDTIFTVVFADSTVPKPNISKDTWDCLQAKYAIGSGHARLIVNRLSPAVLLESPARNVTFKCTAGPRYIAFVKNDRPIVYPTTDLSDLSDDAFAFDEPWVLAWFAEAAPVRAHIHRHDVESEIGVSKTAIGYSRPPEAMDLPVLFRFEHKIESIRRADEGGLVFTFIEKAGKIAVMPLAGGRLFLPEETESWKTAPEPGVLEQCRLWTARLSAFPLTVSEDFDVDPADGVVKIKNDFHWMTFEDDWDSPRIKSAPIPPILALAFSGDTPVEFFHAHQTVEPVDYDFMDTAGLAMGIEGLDGYEYQISGLGELLKTRKSRADVTDPEAILLQQKLESHVRQMVETRHLAPLLYIYGGIGGTWFSHFYWATSTELGQALSAAYPFLSDPLQHKILEYLKSEFKTNPPFSFKREHYTGGSLRTAYEFPWAEMRQLNYALKREQERRSLDHLFELYGLEAYLRLTGEEPSPHLQQKIHELAMDMLAQQDWAIMGPVRRRDIKDRHALFYYNLQGCATYNRWLAGAIGLTRLARRFNWQDEQKLGLYLLAKLSLARIAQARYVSLMYQYGLVRGDPKDDNRTLLHIDTTCAVIGRGPLEVGVHQNQEIPPFNDLTEEVGRWLGKYARTECKIYLDHLDYSLPLWYISEAPKQQATEHRTSPLQNYNGNTLAQYWILGKRRQAFTHYIDTTRFVGDLYYIQNLAAAIDSFTDSSIFMSGNVNTPVPATTRLNSVPGFDGRWPR